MNDAGGREKRRRALIGSEPLVDRGRAIFLVFHAADSRPVSYVNANQWHAPRFRPYDRIEVIYLPTRPGHSIEVVEPLPFGPHTLESGRVPKAGRRSPFW